LAGRGFYVCDDTSCLDKLAKRRSGEAMRGRHWKRCKGEVHDQ
jgi:predicted RNA-binding protein YlxR (DUF448 family)